MVFNKQHKQITLAHWVKRLRDFHSIDAQFCIFSHENPNQSGKKQKHRQEMFSPVIL